MKLRELLENKIPDNLKCSSCGTTEEDYEDDDYVGEFYIFRDKTYCSDCVLPKDMKLNEKITEIYINGSEGRTRKPKTFTVDYARDKLGWDIPFGKKEVIEKTKQIRKDSTKLPKKKMELK